MNMRLKMTVLGLMLVLANVTNAGFELGFTGPSSYNANMAGTAANQTLYLQATGGDTLQSLDTVQVRILAGAGGTTITGFSSTTFTGTYNVGTGTLSLVSNNPLGAASGTTVVNRVDIGLLSFLLGPANSTTPINFTDINASPNIVGVANGVPTVFDGAVTPASQGISVVPEPSALGLAFIGALAFIQRRKRR